MGKNGHNEKTIKSKGTHIIYLDFCRRLLMLTRLLNKFSLAVYIPTFLRSQLQRKVWLNFASTRRIIKRRFSYFMRGVNWRASGDYLATSNYICKFDWVLISKCAVCFSLTGYHYRSLLRLSLHISLVIG